MLGEVGAQPCRGQEGDKEKIMLLILAIVLGRVLASKQDSQWLESSYTSYMSLSLGFVSVIAFASVIKVNDPERGEVVLNYWWVQCNQKDS